MPSGIKSKVKSFEWKTEKNIVMVVMMVDLQMKLL